MLQFWEWVKSLFGQKRRAYPYEGDEVDPLGDISYSESREGHYEPWGRERDILSVRQIIP